MIALVRNQGCAIPAKRIEQADNLADYNKADQPHHV
jgi:hypothetical protein